MKNLFTLFVLAFIVFNTNVAAQSSFLEEELFNYNQVGKINAAMLNDIDDQINQVKVNFDLETQNADAGTDQIEGRIIAAMIITIEDQLEQVDQERRLLDDKVEVLDEDRDSITQKLQGIQILIDEMNL